MLDYSDDGGDACLIDREISLIEETCDDCDCQQRIDMGTPTPQSPRPPSAGNCLAIVFLLFLQFSRRVPFYIMLFVGIISSRLRQ